MVEQIAPELPSVTAARDKFRASGQWADLLALKLALVEQDPAFVVFEKGL